MSHNSVESMRDLAFRKGRHAFKNDADYLAAMEGDLDDLFDSPETDDERLERLGKLLADHTLDSLELLEEWLKDVGETERQDDLPPDFELTTMVSPLALPIMARPLRFHATDAAHVTVAATDCCRIELGTFETTDLEDLVDDIFQGIVDDGLDDDDEDEDEDDESGSEDDSVTGLLDKARTYNVVSVPTMTGSEFIARLRDWSLRCDNKSSLVLPCGLYETIALTRQAPPFPPSEAIILRHRVREGDRVTVECRVMGEADLLDYIAARE